MGDNSGIEWTHIRRRDGTLLRGATWNVVTGCTKVSAGCKYCYAEREWGRFSKAEATRFFGRPFTDVQCHEDLLTLPLRWRAPRGIFVNPRGDLFHELVPFDFIDRIFTVMAMSTRHVFQVLTKRPERMLEYFRTHAVDGRHIGSIAASLSRPRDAVMAVPAWPLPNVWLGVSIENQDTADARIPVLLKVPTAIRWVSAEPLLGAVSLEAWLPRRLRRDRARTVPSVGHDDSLIQWLVVGGESGPSARPMNPQWVRQLRDQCQTANVAFHFKQWGEWSPTKPRSYAQLTHRKWSHESFAWDSFGRVYNPVNPPEGHFPSVMVYRVGKRSAGRLLDGVSWDSYPV